MGEIRAAPRSKARERRLPQISLAPFDAGGGRPGLTIKVELGCEAMFGTKVSAFMEDQISLLIGSVSPDGGHPSEQRIQAILAMVAAVKPKNEIECALAVQMAVTHIVSMDLVGRAFRAGDAATLDARTTAATKFQRTLLAQLDTLARMRRGGKQTVVVQHTTVNGGQAAIVGNVTGGRRRGRAEIKDQTHAANDGRTLELAAGAPLWSANPIRDAVLLPGNEGQGSMPNARRRCRSRGTSE